MHSDVKDFIKEAYIPDLQKDLLDSLDLFESFNYMVIYDRLQAVLDNSSNIPGLIFDKFISIITETQNHILEAHTIKASGSIEDKNIILTALSLVQDLEDYTGIINILESFEDDTVKLCSIIDDLTGRDITTLLPLIDDFNPSILDMLKQHINTKEQLKSKGIKPNLDIISIFKAFIEVCGKDNIGFHLITNGILLEEPIHYYLPFIIRELQEDKQNLAINLLSVVYISKDGISNTLELCKEVYSDIGLELSEITSLESKIMTAINNVNIAYQKEKITNGK